MQNRSSCLDSSSNEDVEEKGQQFLTRSLCWWRSLSALYEESFHHAMTL